MVLSASSDSSMSISGSPVRDSILGEAENLIRKILKLGPRKGGDIKLLIAGLVPSPFLTLTIHIGPTTHFTKTITHTVTLTSLLSVQMKGRTKENERS